MPRISIADITYNASPEVAADLPQSIDVDVPEGLEMEDLQEFLSDTISNQTGFCHTGFTFSSATPATN